MALAVFGGALCIEGAARLLREPPLSVVVRREAEGAGDKGLLIAYDDGRIFGARPGHGDSIYEIDSLGLRGTQRPVEKDEDTRRVLLLGDSVAFGQGMAPDEYVAFYLEQSLRAADPAWEVWNLSFPGWNTAQESYALDALAERLEPDRIVVLWVPNDGASLEHQQFSGTGELVALYTDERIHPVEGLPLELQRFAWRHSAVARIVSDWRGSRARTTGKTIPSIVVADEEYIAAMDRLGRVSERVDAPLLFTMLPPLVDYPGWAVPDAPGRPAPSYIRDAAWKEALLLARERDFPTLDLGSAWVGEKPSTFRISRDDAVHPSAAGHRRMAGVIAEAILAPEAP